jgi:hypothetical protein
LPRGQSTGRPHDDHAVVDGCRECLEEERFHIAWRDCSEGDICPLTA